jgi:hypothetical protein
VSFHHKLIEIVESCTHVEKVLSIDEMVCLLMSSQQVPANALKLAAKIKSAMAKQFDYIRCSIGIPPNTYLAKTASKICLIIVNNIVSVGMIAMMIMEMGMTTEKITNLLLLNNKKFVYRIKSPLKKRKQLFDFNR